MPRKTIPTSRDEFSLSERGELRWRPRGLIGPGPQARSVRRDLSRTIKQSALSRSITSMCSYRHYQVLFSRLGPYDKMLLHELVYRRREFTVTMGPRGVDRAGRDLAAVALPETGHRVRPNSFELFLEEQRDYTEWVLEQVKAQGPLASHDVPDRDGSPPDRASLVLRSQGRTRGPLWPRRAGRGRPGPDFGRVFGLAERIIPADITAVKSRVRRPSATLTLAARAWHRHCRRPRRLLSVGRRPAR